MLRACKAEKFGKNVRRRPLCMVTHKSMRSLDHLLPDPYSCSAVVCKPRTAVDQARNMTVLRAGVVDMIEDVILTLSMNPTPIRYPYMWFCCCNSNSNSTLKTLVSPHSKARTDMSEACCLFVGCGMSSRHLMSMSFEMCLVQRCACYAHTDLQATCVQTIRMTGR